MTTHTATTIAGLTDVGQVRRVNEDAILINHDLKLYAVADGMGGHGSGDVASQLAIETLQECFAADAVSEALNNSDISDDQAKSLVAQCIVGVNKLIHKKNMYNGHPTGTGMGTTLVGLCFIGGGLDSHRAVSFNIGDSRLYEYRNQKLSQLTNDHTMYRDWEENGRVGPAPPRNIIMRAIGLFGEVEIDLDVISIRKDASYLLCSDGLTGMVTDQLIESMIAESSNVEALSKDLVKRANNHGGNDNISVLILAP